MKHKIVPQRTGHDWIPPQRGSLHHKIEQRIWVQGEQALSLHCFLLLLSRMELESSCVGQPRHLALWQFVKVLELWHFCFSQVCLYFQLLKYRCKRKSIPTGKFASFTLACDNGSLNSRDILHSGNGGVFS